MHDHSDERTLTDTPRHRSAAVVIQDGRLLVVTRIKDGRAYAVLPGGGIEAGESAAEAAVRELAEETSLTAVAERRLWENTVHDATYFWMSEVTGEARLAGPELDRSSPTNRYALSWVTADDLDAVGLQPDHLRPHLRELLEL